MCSMKIRDLRNPFKEIQRNLATGIWIFCTIAFVTVNKFLTLQKEIEGIALLSMWYITDHKSVIFL